MAFLSEIRSADSIARLNELLSSDDVHTQVSWLGHKSVCRGEEVVDFAELIEKVHSLGVNAYAAFDSGTIAIDDVELEQGHQLATRIQSLKDSVDQAYSDRNPFFKLIEAVVNFCCCFFGNMNRLNDVAANKIIRDFSVLFSKVEGAEFDEHGNAYNVHSRKLIDLAFDIYRGEFDDAEADPNRFALRNKFYHIVWDVAGKLGYEMSERALDPCFGEHRWGHNQEVLRQALLTLAKDESIESEALRTRLTEFRLFS